MSHPDPTRDKPGQIARGVDAAGVDHNLLVGKDGSLITGAASGLPYGADNYDVTNVTAGPATITYKLGSTVLKTRTFTYTNSGASTSDVLTNVADS